MKSTEEPSYRQRLHAALNRIITEADLDAIVQTLIRRARKGDVEASIVLRDTLDGKPFRPVELSGSLRLVSSTDVLGSDPADGEVREASPKRKM